MTRASAQRYTSLGLALVMLCLLSVETLRAQSPGPHPLVGRILDTRSGVVSAFTDPSLVGKLFPCAAVTLLGEIHDNPDHHAMRAALVRTMVATSRLQSPNCGRGAFLFEHLDADQQVRLDRFWAFEARARRSISASDFFRFVAWDQSGLPARALFQPLVQEVVRSKRAILLGSPSKDWVRRVARDGSTVLPPERVKQLKLDQPMEAALDDALLTELEASHCGLMPKSAFGNMAIAQRYRDAYMAEAALKAANAHGGAVFFAGNGHVRTDRGIPADLRRFAPDRTVVSVTFAEVEEGKLDAVSYVPLDPSGKPATDYVAFAVAPTREDPCEAMRKAMQPK